MRNELARGGGNESSDVQAEELPPGSRVYVSPEPRTLATATERRLRASRRVYFLLALLVLLAALLIILAVSLLALWLFLNQNAKVKTSIAPLSSTSYLTIQTSTTVSPSVAVVSPSTTNNFRTDISPSVATTSTALPTTSTSTNNLMSVEGTFADHNLRS